MGMKRCALLLAAALLLLGCGCAGKQAASQSTTQLRALKTAEGTAVVTQHPGLYDGYEYFGAFTGDWAFVYSQGQAGYRAAGGEYKPLYAIGADAVLQQGQEGSYEGPADDTGLWQRMDWLAENYAYLSGADMVPWYEGGLWGFSDLDGNTKLESQFDNLAAMWAYQETIAPPLPTAQPVQPPEGAEVWWTDPEGEGVYVLVGEKIRRYNAQGTELTTPALARLTLQTDEKGKSTLTITDQDGRQLIQLTSTQPDPLHTESELRFDGDWFYWKTDEGSVLPCRITVE